MQITSPEEVGLSSQRLDRINHVLAGATKDNQLPGIVSLVQRHGKIVHLNTFGMLDNASGKPMRDDALFRIYSMTKPITSVAIMLLLEEGRLNLFDPVATFIPAFGKTKVCTGATPAGLQLVDQQPVMNIHHLLTHMSGLSYGSFYDTPIEEQYRASPAFGRDTKLSDLIEHLATIPLAFQPGTNWRYSMSTDVLGYIVQVIADMPLADFFKERIFKPLGMEDTDFYVPATKLDRLAQIYTSEELTNIRPIPAEAVMLIGNVTKPTTCPYGGAGLVSSINDYLKFSTCMLNKGVYEDGRLLSRKTVEWMTANHIPDSMLPIYMGNDQRDHGFGLGFRVTTHLGQALRLSSIGEYGWGGAACTYFWIDPAEDFIGIMMTQLLSASHYPYNDIFRNLAYQAIID